MSKETKQDRLVRNMIDQVTEHFLELRTLEASPTTKESDIETWCQSFLKNCFGFTSLAGYAIRSQETKGKMRADLVVFKKDKPIIIVEVKKMGFNLDKSDLRSGKVQLTEYLNTIGNVKWGILCNGTRWKLFDFSNPQFDGIEIASFDLKSEEDKILVDKRSVEEMCYEMFDFHEDSYSSNSWTELSKEATAFSPESLSKAILSADVVKYIAKSIRGEFEYKANLEALTDKLYWILEQGLNDAIPQWNDAKVAEIQKYVKAQKRAFRKTRRQKEKTETIESAPDTSHPSESTAVSAEAKATENSGKVVA